MSTSSGSRVRRDGTMAMSSKPYACRADLKMPISTSAMGTSASGKPARIERVVLLIYLTDSGPDPVRFGPLDLGHHAEQLGQHARRRPPDQITRDPEEGHREESLDVATRSRIRSTPPFFQVRL